MLPFQRDTALDTAELRAQLAADQAQLAQSDGVEHIRLLGKIGNTYRMVGQYDEAIRCFEAAIRLARQLPHAALETANRIRLATAIQYAGRHAEAEQLFRQLLENAIEPYRDVVLQHLAKCLVEMDRVEEAVPLLQEALQIRRVKGDADLIASTERALGALEKHG